jgi:hypothetical protein
MAKNFKGLHGDIRSVTEHYRTPNAQLAVPKMNDTHAETCSCAVCFDRRAAIRGYQADLEKIMCRVFVHERMCFASFDISDLRPDE